MRRRHVLTVTVVLLGLTVSPAYAKTKPKTYCNLVKDVANDASIGGAGTTTYDPSLDVVSADIATNAKNLSGVIRLKDLQTSDQDQYGKTGRTWTLSFTAGNNTVGLVVYVTPFGVSFGRGSGVVDYDHNYIQFNVALADVAYAGIKKGVALRNIRASSNMVVGLPPAAGLGYGTWPTGGSVDAATSLSPYPADALSCVKVPA